jgi:hypothetical protein
MKTLAILALSLVPLLLSVAFLWGLLFLREREIRSRTRRNPLNRNLLRSPGQSLQAQIDELTTDLMAHVGLLIAIGPLVANLVYATWLIEGRLRAMTVAIGLVVFLGSCIYVGQRIRQHWKELLKLKLGLDAEEAIGQELNYLMPLGFRVFHDIPCKDFNIDHVVVGASGLFVVETKGRSKPLEESEVTFDGERLQFPGWREAAPIRQVVASTRWLEEWISSAIGEKVRATSVLAIPGWYIERKTSDCSVLTVNGKKMAGVFQTFGSHLHPETVQRIAHQLEERCRTVEPRAYQRPQ